MSDEQMAASAPSLEQLRSRLMAQRIGVTEEAVIRLLSKEIGRGALLGEVARITQERDDALRALHVAREVAHEFQVELGETNDALAASRSQAGGAIQALIQDRERLDWLERAGGAFMHMGGYGNYKHRWGYERGSLRAQIDAEMTKERDGAIGAKLGKIGSLSKFGLEKDSP